MGSLRHAPEALRDYGLRVSVEWQAGRPGVGTGGFIATMGHHTAGRWKLNGQTLMTPSLRIVKQGRPDLPGPLCNFYIGRDRVVRCITTGGANHPGEGGPMTLDGYRIPADSARPYVAGFEIEHDGLDEPWTDEMRDVSTRAFAAILDLLGRDERSHIEHKTWAPGRKYDRARIDLNDERARIRRALRRPAPTTEGDDVTPDEFLRILQAPKVRDEIAEIVWTERSYGSRNMGELVRDAANNSAEAAGK